MNRIKILKVAGISFTGRDILNVAKRWAKLDYQKTNKMPESVSSHDRPQSEEVLWDFFSEKMGLEPYPTYTDKDFACAAILKEMERNFDTYDWKKMISDADIESIVNDRGLKEAFEQDILNLTTRIDNVQEEEDAWEEPANDAEADILDAELEEFWGRLNIKVVPLTPTRTAWGDFPYENIIRLSNQIKRFEGEDFISLAKRFCEEMYRTMHIISNFEIQYEDNMVTERTILLNIRDNDNHFDVENIFSKMRKKEPILIIMAKIINELNKAGL